MPNSRQLDLANKQFCISVNHLAPCLCPVPHFPTNSPLLIGTLAMLCLAKLALAADFPVGIVKSLYPSSAPSWRSTFNHTAWSGTSTHFQSRRQPKRG